MLPVPLQILSSSLNLWELNLFGSLCLEKGQITLKKKNLARTASIKIQDKDIKRCDFFFLFQTPCPLFGKAT